MHTVHKHTLHTQYIKNNVLLYNKFHTLCLLNSPLAIELLSRVARLVILPRNF